MGELRADKRLREIRLQKLSNLVLIFTSRKGMKKADKVSLSSDSQNALFSKRISN